MRGVSSRRRRLGTLFVGAGVLLAGYALVTFLWQDPVTGGFGRWQQHALAASLDKSFRDYRKAEERRHGPAQEASRSDDRAAPRRDLAASARLLEARLEPGRPVGRIVIPKIGVDAVFVQGTRWWPDLARGPGHYEQTSLPGEGKTTAIAGHRTTFGAPFRNIDRLEPGDRIDVELPYGTFRFSVFAHEVVRADDWTIIRERGFDTLVLSACHPLHSASHRWVVYARLAGVDVTGTA